MWMSKELRAGMQWAGQVFVGLYVQKFPRFVMRH
jgi:hypothetical protein